MIRGVNVLEPAVEVQAFEPPAYLRAEVGYFSHQHPRPGRWKLDATCNKGRTKVVQRSFSSHAGNGQSLFFTTHTAEKGVFTHHREDSWQLADRRRKDYSVEEES